MVLYIYIYLSTSIFQVDIFHLQNSYPTLNWKEDYNQHKKASVKICNQFISIVLSAVDDLVAIGNMNLTYRCYMLDVRVIVLFSQLKVHNYGEIRKQKMIYFHCMWCVVCDKSLAWMLDLVLWILIIWYVWWKIVTHGPPFKHVCFVLFWNQLLCLSWPSCLLHCSSLVLL